MFTEKLNGELGSNNGISRRSFTKGTVAALAAVAATGGASSLFGCAPKSEADQSPNNVDGIYAN